MLQPQTASPHILLDVVSAAMYDILKAFFILEVEATWSNPENIVQGRPEAVVFKIF